ncbi:CapA family protein [Clostridium sp.]|uniref:CapA family protein n=1 Tax=Clostridium sp. TaxID=1506 RepID=UPI002FC99E37
MNRDKKISVVLALSVVIFVVSAGYSLFKIGSNMISSSSNPKKEIVKNNHNKNKIEKDNLPDNTEENVTINISGVGDCTLGDDINNKGRGFSSVYKKVNDPKYFFKGVLKELSNDDLTIANLEGPLTTNGKRLEKQFAFRGLPEYTKILKEGSVEAVTLANNHSMDYGDVGFMDTKKYLTSEGIGHFAYDEPAIIEKNGIKIGLLGFKAWSSGEYVRKNVETSIKNIREKVDMVVVSFHWGDERAEKPNKDQLTLGRLAVDSGADLVLGHHPHVIQGIENYNGKNIVYSLSNFSFGGNSNPKDKDSFIYKQGFTFDKNKKLVKIEEYKAIPVRISSVEYKNDYSPVILEGDEAVRVMDKLTYRSGLIN